MPRQIPSVSWSVTSSQRVRADTEKNRMGVVGRHPSAVCRAVAARQWLSDARSQRCASSAPERHVRFVAARPRCRGVSPEARVQYSAGGELGILDSSIPAEAVRQTVKFTCEGGSRASLRGCTILGRGAAYTLTSSSMQGSMQRRICKGNTRFMFAATLQR